MSWIVRIVETATNKIEKEFTCESERRAEKLADGLSINLDWERFHVETKEVTASRKTPARTRPRK